MMLVAIIPDSPPIQKGWMASRKELLELLGVLVDVIPI